MQSTVYPNIIFIKNQNLSFMGSLIIPDPNLILLHPSDPLIEHYTIITKKLFKEIKIIKEMLWIGRIKSTQIIRIYFSQPYEYPTSSCCHQPVFIEIENDVNGIIVCYKCNKQVLHFVRAAQEQVSEEQIFRRTRKEIKTQKQQLRVLLTSQKFRDRKLKNNFVSETPCKQGDLIVQITNSKSQIAQPFKNQETLPEPVQQLRDIINDIFS